ncbi:hypothetical protein [Sporosarcina ureae]|uniref:hypothetical protein n=1 Tax=Sporosarcina ureae TaxID=1571 RepID=UPI000A17B4E8|nr:hypothetical protein [Sporosarcina ureae]ARK21897.1 hypothetical protein SporoP32a_10390 [Sporosarcina ureae]
MKKLFMLMITAAFLAACSNDEPKEAVESTEPTEETAPTEQTSDGVEEGLKEDTVEREYAAFANDEVPVNSKVKFLGKVTAVDEEEVYSVESDADETIYVKDIRLGDRTDILEGFDVSVYGTYDGKDDEGVPVIKGIFIDAD